MSQTSLFHVTRPATSGTEPHAALVLLHGLGSDEQDLLSISPHVDPRLYVFSARAPLTHRWGGYSWFDYEREGPGIGGRTIEQSMRSITAFLHEIVRDYPIDARRIYVGGFSMGAAMAGSLALLQPNLAAGTIMISGFLPPDVVPARYRPAELVGHPIFQAHGTWDQTVSIVFARQTRDYLLGSAADLTYREYPIGHEISDQVLRDLTRWMLSVLETNEAVEQP